MKCFLSKFDILQLGSPKKGLNWYTSCVLWWLAERQCTKMCSAVVASNWRISIHACSCSDCTFSFDPDSTSIFCPASWKLGCTFGILWATRNGTMRFVNPFAPGSCKGAEWIILVITSLHIFHNRSLEDPFLLLHPSTDFFQTPTHQHFVKQLVSGFWETRFQQKLPVDYDLWQFPCCLGISPPQPGLHRNIPSNARSFRSLNASPICGLRCHGQNRALWVFGRMLDVLPSRMC